jgi:hypothetical protein
MIQPRTVLRCLNWLVSAGAVGMFVVLAFQDGSVGTWVAAGAIALVFGFLGVVADAKIAEEEVARVKRAELAARMPVQAAAEALNEATRGLLSWSKWLAALAFAVGVLMLTGACGGGRDEGVAALVSGIAWVGIATAAWFVRNRASRMASVLLLLASGIQLAAALLAVAQERVANDDLLPAVLVPLLLVGMATRCCLVTFRYHSLTRVVR